MHPISITSRPVRRLGHIRSLPNRARISEAFDGDRDRFKARPFVRI